MFIVNVLAVNVNKLHSSFADTKKAEMMMEGKAFHTAKLLGDSESVEDKNAAASGVSYYYILVRLFLLSLLALVLV